MAHYRLGDVIDDHCIKCRRVTNHSIVSLVGDQAAKVRCRTCYHDHDYRHEQAPPSKKELKKLAESALAKEAAASANGNQPDSSVKEVAPEKAASPE
jgi:HEAT repeat protein